MSDATIAPATAAPAEPQAATAAPPAEARPHVAEVEPEPSEEYEIDGKKVPLTRTQARTWIQKAGAVDKRMQEASEQKKKLDAIVAEFDKDPEAALRKVGRDPEKILEALLVRKAKLQLMSPEQQAAAKLQEERDELKAKLETLEKEKLEQHQKSLDEKNQQALETQLIAVAEKYGMDKTPATLEGLADTAMDLLSYGMTPTVDEVAQEYLHRESEQIEKRDRKLLPTLKGERLKSYLKTVAPVLLALPPAELLELLGPAGVKTIREATLTKIPAASKKPLVPPPVAPKSISPPPRNDAGRFVNEADFDKKFRR